MGLRGEITEANTRVALRQPPPRRFTPVSPVWTAASVSGERARDPARTYSGSEKVQSVLFLR